MLVHTDRGLRLTDLKGQVEFSHVSFVYPARYSALAGTHAPAAGKVCCANTTERTTPIVLRPNPCRGVRPDQQILKDVSLSLRPGQVLALVGPSGQQRVPQDRAPSVPGRACRLTALAGFSSFCCYSAYRRVQAAANRRWSRSSSVSTTYLQAKSSWTASTSKSWTWSGIGTSGARAPAVGVVGHNVHNHRC